MKGIFITGTDTNVGKTWVSKQLIKALTKEGIDVIPRKPVESGWNDDETKTDAWILASATNKNHDIDAVCPNQYKTPISPDKAALIEGKKTQVSTLKNQCLLGVGKDQFLFVEGAGGFYSPLCSDGLNADLAVQLDLPIILIVGNKLGCINHTLLTIEAIQSCKLALLAVVLNDVNELAKVEGMDNAESLRALIHYPVITVDNTTITERSFATITALLKAG